MESITRRGRKRQKASLLFDVRLNKLISLRRIKVGEGSLYKRMRLTLLSDSQNAFARTFESANSRSLNSRNEQADSTAVGTDRVTIFAFFNDEPVGIVALYRDDQTKDSGEVIQFWG